MLLKKKLAFSLIEISVVILIISTLAFLVTGGSRMIERAKLLTGQVNDAPASVFSESVLNGILLWCDASSSDNVIGGSVGGADAASVNGGQVKTCKDINPSSPGTNNLSAPSDSNRPTYVTGAINGLSALRYNGTTNYLRNAGNIFNTLNASIFVVAKVNAILGGRYLFSTGAYYEAGNLSMTTNSSGYYFNTFVSDTSSPSPSSTRTIANINSANIFYYQVAGVNSESRLNSVLGYNPSISPRVNSYIRPVYVATYELYPTNSFVNFAGDIGEVIVFDKTLTTPERQEVEAYLSSKWGIPLTN